MKCIIEVRRFDIKKRQIWLSNMAASMLKYT